MSATQITQRFIANGAIADAQVQAGAAIASSKLADGANWIKKDGSVAMTGPFDAGSQKVINLATGTISSDGVNLGQMNTAIAAVNQLFTAKGACRVAMTTNVTLTAPGGTLDGVTMVSGDRMILTGQTTTTQNGIYIWNGAAVTATRSTDMDVWSEVVGALVTVESDGTANKNTVWLATVPQTGTIGATAISFTNIIVSPGLTNSNFVIGETPSGTVNGVNVTFTLANTPVAGSLDLYDQGIRLNVGAGNDYTISSATITMLTAPLTGEVLLADYRK